MTTLPHARSVVAVATVVAFNLLMVLLAAIGQVPISAPFVVLWFVGDFVLCLAALALRDARRTINADTATSRSADIVPSA